MPSLEDVLQIVAGALEKSTQPGIGRVELELLKTIADLHKAYVDGLERYVRYRKIEERLDAPEEYHKTKDLLHGMTSSDTKKRQYPPASN